MPALFGGALSASSQFVWRRPRLPSGLANALHSLADTPPHLPPFPLRPPSPPSPPAPLQGYGLTETCAASFIMMPDPRLAYTVGPPLAATEFRLESVPELKYDAHAKPPRVREPLGVNG